MQRVFARRDSAIRPGQSAQNLEAPLAGDQALMFQHGGQLAERRPFRHHDDPDRRRLGSTGLIDERQQQPLRCQVHRDARDAQNERNQPRSLLTIHTSSEDVPPAASPPDARLWR